MQVGLCVVQDASESFREIVAVPVMGWEYTAMKKDT
jgi:hypothetical protein